MFEQCGVRTKFDPFFNACGFRAYPFFRLFKFSKNKYAKKSRNRADEKHCLPRFQTEWQEVLGGDQSDRHADESGSDVAPTRKRLQQSERRRVSVIRNRVGDQSDGQTKDAADTESGEKKAGTEAEETRDEGAQSGADGINQHRHGEHPGAAIAVAK